MSISFEPVINDLDNITGGSRNSGIVRALLGKKSSKFDPDKVRNPSAYIQALSTRKNRREAEEFEVETIPEFRRAVVEDVPKPEIEYFTTPKPEIEYFTKPKQKRTEDQSLSVSEALQEDEDDDDDDDEMEQLKDEWKI